MNRTRTLSRLLLALALLASGAGCPSVAERVAIKNCHFNLRGLKIVNLSPFEVTLRLTIGVYNPNEIQVVVDRFDYTLFIDGLKAADGANRHPAQIPVRQQRDLVVDLRVNVTDAARVIPRLRAGGRHQAKVEGTVYIGVPWGEYPYPLSFTGSF